MRKASEPFHLSPLSFLHIKAFVKEKNGKEQAVVDAWQPRPNYVLKTYRVLAPRAAFLALRCLRKCLQYGSLQVPPPGTN